MNLGVSRPRIEDHVARLRAAQLYRPPVNKRQARARAVPFRNDELMEGPPGCPAADFDVPRLRRCPFDLANIDWKASSRLGGGLDGYVWKVWFKGDGSFVLKVVSEPSLFIPPEMPADSINSFGTLSHMSFTTTSLCSGNDSASIIVKAKPETKYDALDNIHAISTEGRDLWVSAGASEVTVITSIPRMRKCYGWLKFNGQSFLNMPPKLWAPSLIINKINRNFSPDKGYFAILYEFVEGENDPATVEKVDDFSWLSGFGHNSSPLEKNWKSGVLIDLSDIVHAGGFGWPPKSYGARPANRILRP